LSVGKIEFELQTTGRGSTFRNGIQNKALREFDANKYSNKKKIAQRYQSVVNGITERFFREKTTLDFELSFFRIVEINRHQKISVHILILNTFTKISRD
jgi:hypothetical protein